MSTLNVATVNATTTLNTSSINGGQLAGFRNRIINGGFDVWQRGTSFSPVANGQVYTADRFFMNRNGVSEWTVARQGTSEQYSCRVQRNAGTTSTQPMRVRQVLESADCAGIVGKTVTFSCEIKVGANFSAAAGHVTLTISQGTGIDESSTKMATGFTGVVNTGSNKVPTTSFEKYSVTTPVIGATISQLGVLIEATPVGTAGADDWYEIRNLQLEVGSTATEFEQRPIGTELALCQRYLPAYNADSASGKTIALGQNYATTNAMIVFPFVVEPRVPPTGISISAAGDFRVTAAVATALGVTGLSFSNASRKAAQINATVASGLVAGDATRFHSLSAAAKILFTGCEL